MFCAKVSNEKDRQKGARRSHPRVVCSKVVQLHCMRECVKDPDPQSSVAGTRTGLHCSIFVQRFKIYFLKAMYVEKIRLVFSYFSVQLISPLHKYLTTPRCNTICSDPSSEALVSLSNPSGYWKPYQSLPLCCPASEPCFPTACYQFTISNPQGSFIIL